MAIYKLVQNTPLGPEEIRRLTTAYELTLKALASKIAATPSRNSSPKRYSRIGQTCIEDPAQISKLAIKQLDIT
jgi:hypothetical protein